jgi:hypothetical protein
MSLKDAAAREAYLKTLLDEIDTAYKATRAEVQQLLDEAAEETGTRQIGAALPDGRQIATVSISSGSAEAKVADEDTFMEWVRDTFPTEVERKFTTTVRTSFRSRVLKELTAIGGTDWPDPESGLIHEVPGVHIAPARARTHAVRFTKTGRADIAQAWRDGLLAEIVLPQLTAAPEETA